MRVRVLRIGRVIKDFNKNVATNTSPPRHLSIDQTNEQLNDNYSTPPPSSIKNIFPTPFCSYLCQGVAFSIYFGRMLTSRYFPSFYPIPHTAKRFPFRTKMGYSQNRGGFAPDLGRVHSRFAPTLKCSDTAFLSVVSLHTYS